MLLRLQLGVPCQINKVLSHPTLPITITAQEDRHIKFFDNNSGKLIHSMVAHLDAVTSLAVDPNGLYLMSGSKCPQQWIPVLQLTQQFFYTLDGFISSDTSWQTVKPL